MAKRSKFELFTVSQSFDKVNLETLRPLAKFVSPDAPTRKMDIVPYLTKTFLREDEVRRIYESLNPLAKSAIQEAVADPMGELDSKQFRAKYRELPNFGTREAPTRLNLFFPVGWSLPVDLRPILEKFVSEPPPVSIDTCEELPPAEQSQVRSWRLKAGESQPEVSLRQRSTAPVALREFTTILRLVESGVIRVSDKTRKPSKASVEAVAPLLVDGDFYQPEDRSKHADDPGSDLAIRAFAWPCLLQAAGLVTLSGGKLSLSPAGRKALVRPVQEGIRAAWKKWVATKLFDEFERVEAIKGKQSARPSAVDARRRAVDGVLEECPQGRWIDIDEFFRFLRANDLDFTVTRDVWKLYIAELNYGNFGYEGRNTWELLQGRFIMTMLFEYAATLGLIDVAYITPQGARDDFHNHWGADDYECLSRYDGLKYFRINALGAWCLDLTERYEPEPLIAKKTWKVLPNHDIVSSELNPDPADVMFLNRFADHTSDRVWRLDRDKILTAVEAGLTINAVSEFLESHSSEPIAPTVQRLLADLQENVGRVRDVGTVRMIECTDAETARLLLLDSKLKTLCMPAGERNLIFQTSDEAAVRSRLRKLGYVIPSVE